MYLQILVGLKSFFSRKMQIAGGMRQTGYETFGAKLHHWTLEPCDLVVLVQSPSNIVKNSGPSISVGFF